jgi:hypothetical protein
MFPYPPPSPAIADSRKDNRPNNRAPNIDKKNALAVARVVAITNGGLLSSSNGVFASILKNNAGKDT